MQKIKNLLPKGDFATCEKRILDEFGNMTYCGCKAEYVDTDHIDDETDKVEPAQYFCERHGHADDGDEEAAIGDAVDRMLSQIAH